MNLGFTGTRAGMTTAQQVAFIDTLQGWTSCGMTIRKFRHGDCIGSDEQAHDIVRRVLPSCWIEIHPGMNAAYPEDTSNRAGKRGDYEYPMKTHFARNRAIVAASDVIIATPREAFPSDVGGTWYTIDRAIKAGKQLYIIWPDGHATSGRNP